MSDDTRERPGAPMTWPRPVPTVGDTTSARTRRDDPAGWGFPEADVDALTRIIDARRDIRRYRPDPVPAALVERVVTAGHHGPSVGHSQPWRFIVVGDPGIRDRAAAMADRGRVRQAAGMTEDRAARLLDLKLEGLREAPLGIVVACDRRVPADGVLGRATFPDADMWSCAAAIENMWLTSRALGLGMGWVTLFEPAELAGLLGLPEGVETLGWLCLGWPDERPPSPGLERAAWSRRLPVEDVLLHDHWPHADQPARPASHLKVTAPAADRMVEATDGSDELLSPPESLGLLDRVLNRITAIGGAALDSGILVLAGADHPVAAYGVSAFPSSAGRDVVEAAAAGRSVGVAAATSAGLAHLVIDAGIDGGPVPGVRHVLPSGPRGDLAGSDALGRADVDRMLEAGREIGREVARHGLVAIGEVGIGNTTVAAALTCALTGLEPGQAVGLGSGADAAMLARKQRVVEAALARWRAGTPAEAPTESVSGHNGVSELLAVLGGGEIAVLTGVVLGAVEAGSPVVLDGLAGSLPGLCAARIEPAVQAYLVAGQVSRERAHRVVLDELGLEPLLALRMRAGEGVGACLAASMILQGLSVRRLAARTSDA
ncbi:cob(II)yrinic acid a,c-diamide reductase [Raineyella antarctica]|uniref:Cob(II)yrinic acid a,c-diamide reductase n=1 Tax=Raineyella antarctica TaxID=1577474 RepID=A0A1G6GMR9_9ACTN|nr:5,6-dimethylbenzimidazole synthase [Raineyella antarctica]SDB83340.1 cob(II)yrinic acid a,c-diamide reductase [Raineyella antarctica]